MTLGSLLQASREHRILAGLLITGLILAAIEIPYLVVARSGGPLRTLDAVGTPVSQDRPAPPLALPALDGTGAITVGTPSARLTVLNFWASWCTACRGEAPDLQRLWRAYGRRVQFIGVDVADHATDARAFQRRFGITYPSGVDPHLAVVSRYGAFGLPFTFVIDRAGRIRAEVAGQVDEPSLRDVLTRLLNE